MAQLIVVPIQEKGDAVLIVAFDENRPFIGYITIATLEAYFRQKIAACECLLLADHNLKVLESIIATKSKCCEPSEGLTPCVEVVLSDIHKSRMSLSRRALDLARRDWGRPRGPGSFIH